MKLLACTVAIALGALPAFAREAAVPICELLQHPTRYDGKLIRTRGTTVGRDSGCGMAAPLWVETHDGRFGANLGRPETKAVTIIGIFHWRPSTEVPAILKELP